MPVQRQQVPLRTAKSWAKRLVDASKTIAPRNPWKLSQGQKAIAKILGFIDWHELEGSLGPGSITTHTPVLPNQLAALEHPENIGDWGAFWRSVLEQDGVCGVMLEHRTTPEGHGGICVRVNIHGKQVGYAHLEAGEFHTHAALAALWPEAAIQSLFHGESLDYTEGHLRICNSTGQPHTYQTIPVYPLGRDIYLCRNKAIDRIPLDQMGIPTDVVVALKRFVERPTGGFVFCGSNGSMKENLMLSCLDHVHQRHRYPREWLLPRLASIPVIRSLRDSDDDAALDMVSIQDPGANDFRICVVEDQSSALNADFTRVILSHHGSDEHTRKAVEQAMRGNPHLVVLSELRRRAGGEAFHSLLEKGIAAWTSFNSTPSNVLNRLDDFLPGNNWVKPGCMQGWAACRTIGTLCPQCSVSAQEGLQRLNGAGCARCRGTGRGGSQLVVDLWEVVDGKPVRLFSQIDQAKGLVKRGLVSLEDAKDALGPLTTRC